MYAKIDQLMNFCEKFSKYVVKKKYSGEKFSKYVVKIQLEVIQD
jgi:hypothetical protein